MPISCRGGGEMLGKGHRNLWLWGLKYPQKRVPFYPHTAKQSFTAPFLLISGKNSLQEMQPACREDTWRGGTQHYVSWKHQKRCSCFAAELEIIKLHWEKSSDLKLQPVEAKFGMGKEEEKRQKSRSGVVGTDWRRRCKWGGKRMTHHLTLRETSTLPTRTTGTYDSSVSLHLLYLRWKTFRVQDITWKLLSDLCLFSLITVEVDIKADCSQHRWMLSSAGSISPFKQSLNPKL